MASRPAYRLAIVGATTLKGRDLKEVLEERNFPAIDVKLLDDDQAAGQLDAVGEEPAFIQGIRADQFEKVDFTFFATDPKTTLDNWRSATRAGSAVIDLSYALEDESGVQVRSPWISAELDRVVPVDLDTIIVVIAHPAAVVLALLLLRAQRAGTIRHASATILEPVSEAGKEGMDELHRQTLNLLSFQPLPQEFYGSQVAFNILARYGERSTLDLEQKERRIVSHFKKITGGRVSVPSVRLLQAPVFHSYTFSIYLDMLPGVSKEALSRALCGEHVMVTGGEDTAVEEGLEQNSVDQELPDNVTAAGRNEILVSVREDRDAKSGYWLWIAVDNFKIAALTALDCAAGLAAAHPVDQVQ